MKRQSFTLFELLADAAIIAVLASLLLPVLNRARSAAQTAVCKDNLVQIGKAGAMYSQTNDEWIVPDRVRRNTNIYWPTILSGTTLDGKKYSNGYGITFPGRNPRTGTLVDPGETGGRAFTYGHYAINCMISGYAGWREPNNYQWYGRRNLSSIRQPSAAIMFADGVRFNNHTVNDAGFMAYRHGNGGDPRPATIGDITKAASAAAQAKGEANISYLDGHVGSRKYGSVCNCDAVKSDSKHDHANTYISMSWGSVRTETVDFK